MRRIILNLALLFALVFSVGVNWLVRGDGSKPNREFLPQMAHSPRYNAYAPNPNFADGKTLQAPPPGSIARGMMPLHYAATPADAKRAGDELQSPITPDDYHPLTRGAVVFKNFCTPCHGAEAKGNGPVAMRGYPPPPSLVAPHAVQMKDGQMFHVLTFGQNNMPSYASQLSRQDRWYVIGYVRSVQALANRVPNDEAPPNAPLPTQVPPPPAKPTGGQQ